MAGHQAFNVIKTVIIPLIVATVIYVVLSFILIPFYRRYRADITRYSQYAPLTSTLHSTTSIFGEYIPESLRPRSIREKLGDFLVRTVLPSMWALRDRGRSFRDGDADGRDSVTSDEDGGLFDEESGERMVGFDMNQGRRGRVNRQATDDRFRVRGPEVNHNPHVMRGDEQGQGEDYSDRRLSRELEEGFRDDSGSELSDEEVTVGRRRLSMAGTR